MSLGTLGKFVVFIPGGGVAIPPYYMPLQVGPISWINMAGAGPGMLNNAEPSMLFDPAATEEARGSFVVPWDYDDNSNLQLFLRCKYDAMTDNNPAHLAKMETTSGYCRDGQALQDPFAGPTHVDSADWYATAAQYETQTSPWMALTTLTGTIGGSGPVAIGDEVHLALRRMGGAGGDDIAADLRVRVNSVEIAQLVT